MRLKATNLLFDSVIKSRQLLAGFFNIKKLPSGTRTPWGLCYSNEALNNMVNDKQFTFKFLGVFMEVINFTPKELRKTMWTAAVILLLLVLTWRLPEMISAIKWW